MNGAISFFLPLVLIAGCGIAKPDAGKPAHANKSHVLIEMGIVKDRLSEKWLDALQTRMGKDEIDSLAALSRPVTREEEEWQKLIESRLASWAGFTDSLKIPFADIPVSDTTTILLGFRGMDDGFTYRDRTVCFDLTALQSNYGMALSPENGNRIDRLYAHEFTHLLHKEWFRLHNYTARTFADSILWECLYEGIGMYRSLTAKWLPRQGELPPVTREALAELTPVFVDRISSALNNPSLTGEEKMKLRANLSRGPVQKKWGAFPIAIWLALEANGDDSRLVKWINKGPEAVIELGKTYLAGENKKKFEKTFPGNAAGDCGNEPDTLW